MQKVIKPARWLLLALMVQLLTACSSTTFFYNRLHILVPWYLGSYVDLTREQRQNLDQTLAHFLQQHRRDELPRYVDILDQATAMLDREIAADDVAALYSQAEQAADRLQAEALEWLLALGVELSDEQVRGLIAELQERQDDYRDKYLDRDDGKYRSDAYNSLRKNARKYLGRLTSDQRPARKAGAGQWPITALRRQLARIPPGLDRLSGTDTATRAGLATATARGHD